MSNVTGRSWPTKRAPDGYATPTNAAVPTTQPWPKARDSAAGTAAMDILADAVFRIDAADHQRSGAPAKVVRNLGTGGSVLDCRTGSTSVPDTNDPLFLPVESSAYVYLPGVTSNELRVANDLLSGVISFRCFIRNTSTVTPTYLYTSAATTALTLQVRSATTIRIIRSSAGADSNTIPNLSTSGTWVEVEYTTSTGAVTYRYSDDGTNWTSAGTTTVASGDIAAGTTYFGSNSGSSVFTGMFYRGQIIDDGTTVLDVDTSVLTTGSATSFTAVTGQTVTINRSTSGRKTVVVPSAERKLVDAGNVYLPGVNSNYLSAPDAANLRVTGDLDVRVRAALDSWTPTATSALASRYGSSVNRSWSFNVTATGLLRLDFTTDGTTVLQRASTVATGLTAGAVKWVRFTLDVDNGASGHDVKFYTSDDGSTWTQLGNTVTTAGTVTLFAGTAQFEVGSVATGLASVAAGKFYRAQLVSDPFGTPSTVLDIDTSIAPTNFTPGYASAFPAVTGQTVTLNSTAGSAMRVNGERWASGGPVWLFGTDDYMEVPASATGSKALDFGPNDSFTVLAVVRQWATQVADRAYMAKRLTSFGRGWFFTPLNSTTHYFVLNDGTNSVSLNSTAPAAGLAATYAITVNRQSTIISTTVNNAQPVTTSNRPASDATNTQALRIGSYGNSSSDTEIMTAAIWRRALTAAEISTLTNYFQGRYA